MNYVNYDKAIVEKYRVKILGWPDKEAPFVNPSEIGAISTLRILHKSWKSGATHWVKLNARETQEHLDMMEEKRKAGQSIGRPRKQRSDAGKKRGKHKVTADEDENNENNDPRPSKRAKVAGGSERSCAIPKSKEIIEDSDDEEDDE